MAVQVFLIAVSLTLFPFLLSHLLLLLEETGTPLAPTQVRWEEESSAPTIGGGHRSSSISNQPPPPTSAARSWKKHTIGGCCIYCGAESKSPDHLATCTKHKKRKSEEESQERPDEDSNKKRDEKRTCQEETSSRKNPANVTPLLLGALGSHRKDLFPTSTIKECPSGLGAAFRCLACDKEGCPFENGYTVMEETNREQDQEHDPCEPANQKGWNARAPEHFLFKDSMVTPVRTAVLRTMHSNGFWSSHKFIGNRKLDFKLRCWMKMKLDSKVVEQHWHPLRRAVKEALRFKRQQSVAAIRRLYYGESCNLLCCVRFFFSP